MITKSNIRVLMDESEHEYEVCWEILCALKSGSVKDDLLDFQPRLASVLFRLDKMYCLLNKERKRLESNKRDFSRSWIQRRLNSIKKYQDAMKKMMTIGRSLGDSFAWFFYQGSTKQIQKHLKHELIPHTAPGDGGLGELEFIRNVKSVGGKMVIYHGTTTFLRIGDASLIDLKTSSVSAVVEMKTKRTSADEIEVQLHIVGDKEFWSNGQEPSLEPEHQARVELPQLLRERLDRQIKQMAELFSLTRVNKTVEFQSNNHVDELNYIATKIQKIGTVYKQIGEGLLLIVVNDSRRKSLYSKILRKSEPNWGKLIDNVESQAFQLMDMTQSNTPINTNSIIIGNLDPVFLIGLAPSFWWPVSNEFLHKIFFLDIHISTLYNPAHLARKLREMGFEVTPRGKGDLHVKKAIGECEMVVQGMNYFMQTIQTFLRSEDYVCKILSRMVDEAENGKLPIDSETTMMIQHHF